MPLLRCTAEEGKSKLFRGGLATRREGRHPRSREKASYSGVSRRVEEKACTAEAGESKLLRGGLASRREGMHRGRRKKQVTQW